MTSKLIPTYCPVCLEQMKPVTKEATDQFWCAFHGYFLTGLDDDGQKHAVD